MARENDWGYTRILGELKKLGIKPPSRNTVKNILKENGLEPGPKRGAGTWDERRGDVYPILPRLEVEVGSGGAASGTHVPDHLSLCDGYTGTDSRGEALQMGVAACVRSVVLEIERFAVTPIPARF